MHTVTPVFNRGRVTQGYYSHLCQIFRIRFYNKPKACIRHPRIFLPKMKQIYLPFVGFICQ